MIPILEPRIAGYDGAAPASIGRSLHPTHGSAGIGIRGAELACSRDERPCGLLEERLGARGASGETLGHERAPPSAALDQSLGLERPVRLGDGVRRETDVLGERPDGRETRAGCERAAVDALGEGRRELIRERPRRSFVERDAHGRIIPLPERAAM